MHNDFLEQYTHLRQQNEPFATATVVWREAPSSGQVGNRAIIDSRGDVWGWVGGGCTRGIMLKEAKAAMTEGNPRLVRVSPDLADTPQSGIVAYKMTCQSGGSIEMLIEPVLPRPHLIVLGKSAIARAVVQMALLLDYRLTVMAMGATEELFPGVSDLKQAFSLSKMPISRHTFVVVATQGEQDEMALKAALKAAPPYVAFVASRKKRDAVFTYLRSAGVAETDLARVKSPAGLDINAKTPHEVAVSILAEVIETLRTPPPTPADVPALTNTDERYYINPVCGIPVDKATPKHVIQYKDETVYFCCDGCTLKFEANPNQYMQV